MNEESSYHADSPKHHSPNGSELLEGSFEHDETEDQDGKRQQDDLKGRLNGPDVTIEQVANDHIRRLGRAGSSQVRGGKSWQRVDHEALNDIQKKGYRGQHARDQRPGTVRLFESQEKGREGGGK